VAASSANRIGVAARVVTDVVMMGAAPNGLSLNVFSAPPNARTPTHTYKTKQTNISVLHRNFSRSPVAFHKLRIFPALIARSCIAQKSTVGFAVRTVIHAVSFYEDLVTFRLKVVEMCEAQR
jgi:hypothetical protein